MNPDQLRAAIRNKKSLLCIGLDPDVSKIPPHLLKEKDPVLAFNTAIIEATSDLAIAYKPNLAFYEALGASGWQTLAETNKRIPKNCFTIADAKRGDIGNTSEMYAKAFFETLGFDAITVAPYMGVDSVSPFLGFKDKWVFLLALTSNPGAEDFQYTEGENPLYAKVVRTACKWAENRPGHIGFVVGATRAARMKEIREIAGDKFFLVPGVGAQGGSLADSIEAGGLDMLVNSSREILYASSGIDFAEAASARAQQLQKEMAAFLA